ncbi:MAG: alanine racemase, partial [Aurantimonas coralicida]
MPVVEIDRAALAANWTLLAARNPGARTGAAVKADGYGLGAAETARTLPAAGCRDFFVAWAEEGRIVRA